MLKLTSSLFRIPIVNSVILYDEIDSTNNGAKILGNQGAVDGTLVVADMQTAGKGRLGRSFSSPAGEGIYMSLLLRPSVGFASFSQITLLSAYALVKTLEEYPELSPQIKWPNDIVVNGKKVVGILTEANSEKKYAVLGIGINVNNKNFPDNLQETATSLFLESGIKYERSALIESFLIYFNQCYQQFLRQGNLAFLQDEYNHYLAGFGQEIYLIPHDQTMQTKNPYLIDTKQLTPYLCMGIDPVGNLICRHEDGTLITVNSGEVSVRGLHGYMTR